MSRTVDPNVDEAMGNLETAIGDLPQDKQAPLLDAVAELLNTLFNPVEFDIERRPNSPLYPTAEQVQTVVNRLRDKTEPQPDKKRAEDER